MSKEVNMLFFLLCNTLMPLQKKFFFKYYQKKFDLMGFK